MATSQPSSSSSTDSVSLGGLDAQGLWDIIKKLNDHKAASHPIQAFPQTSMPLHLDANTTTAFFSSSSSLPSSSRLSYMTPYSHPVRNNWNGGSSVASTAIAPSVFDSGTSEVTCLTTPSEAPAHAHPPGLYLCEFLGLEDCTVTYNPGQEDEWIDHIAVTHMHNKIPRKSVCWYCDDIEFDSNTDDMSERLVCFRQRMTHIGQHLMAGVGLQRPIRPDFALVRHLCDEGLCDESRWTLAMEFDENPYRLPKDLQDCSPSTASNLQARRVPVSSVNVPQTSRSWRSSRPRREQKYHT